MPNVANSQTAEVTYSASRHPLHLPSTILFNFSSCGLSCLQQMMIDFDMTVALITSRKYCPCRLQSHGGDVEEAISFLELTSLTATPGQLTQLGLLPPPELSPPIRVPHPAANGASSRDGGQAASPPADVAAVDGEDHPG